MKTLVLEACFRGLIKTLYFFDYWVPSEICWFPRLPGKVPDVGRCNQPLPETQSLWKESVSKYRKCVLKPQKAVQSSWKWMFMRRNDERVCTICRGINVSSLWTWTVSRTIKVLQHHQDSSQDSKTSKADVLSASYSLSQAAAPPHFESCTLHIWHPLR